MYVHIFFQSIEESKTFGVSSDSEHLYTEIRTVVPDEFYSYRVLIQITFCLTIIMLIGTFVFKINASIYFEAYFDSTLATTIIDVT